MPSPPRRVAALGAALVLGLVAWWASRHLRSPAAPRTWQALGS